VTVYEKSLLFLYAVPTNCVGTLITALVLFKLFSYTVTTTNCVGTLITALVIFKLFSYTVEEFEENQSGVNVPTQFVGTAYKKSLKIAKEVFKILTQFVVVRVYEKSLKQTVCEL
jgi:hypothetical protein